MKIELAAAVKHSWYIAKGVFKWKLFIVTEYDNGYLNKKVWQSFWKKSDAELVLLSIEGQLK